MQDITFPKIITFYSYKGGVGRSMAMMNVAYTLASWGRHVLMVDMDLEAPGVSGFLERNEELDPPLQGLKDVLSLLTEVKRLSSQDRPPKELADEIPPITNFIRTVKREKLASLKPEFGQPGRLDLLGPDLHRNFETRLAHLALYGHTQPELVAMSRILHYYLKAQRFPFQLEWLKDIEPEQPTPYDYILVDSRTGITEIGGLCVGPLAESLVVVTGLNDQNVEGTRSFLALTGVRKLEFAAPTDGEPTPETTLGPKPTLIVASPVPSGEMTYRNQRLAELERVLHSKPSRLSYHPQLALMETVFVRDYPDEHLANEYIRLSDRILSMSKDSPKTLEKLLQDNLDPAEMATAITLIEKHAPRSPQPTIAWAMLLAFQLEPNDPDSTNSRVRINALIAESPDNRIPGLVNLGVALSDQAKSKSGPDADSLFQLADHKFAEAIRLRPEHANAWHNWGATFMFRLQTAPPGQTPTLLAKAQEAFDRAESLQPGIARYNQACLAAIQNDTVKALEFLEAARTLGTLPNKQHLQSDADLINLRHLPAFQHLLSTLPDTTPNPIPTPPK